jgi:hypothetical protein
MLEEMLASLRVYGPHWISVWVIQENTDAQILRHTVGYSLSSGATEPGTAVLKLTQKRHK